jgi:hypothetical protein
VQQLAIINSANIIVKGIVNKRHLCMGFIPILELNLIICLPPFCYFCVKSKLNMKVQLSPPFNNAEPDLIIEQFFSLLTFEYSIIRTETKKAGFLQSVKHFGSPAVIANTN